MQPENPYVMTFRDRAVLQLVALVAITYTIGLFIDSSADGLNVPLYAKSLVRTIQ